MLIKLSFNQTVLYNRWLTLYKDVTGNDPTFIERTESFFCVRNNRIPSWAVRYQ